MKRLGNNLVLPVQVVEFTFCTACLKSVQSSVIVLFLLLSLQVLQELIGNEKKFVTLIEELINTYLKPLENNSL